MANFDREISWLGSLSFPILTFWAWARRKSLKSHLIRVEKKLDDLIFHLATNK